MKNKVDIGKLIEKKYKGNTLDLSDILEQIDLVLQETSDYKYNSKIDTGNLEENPQSVNISQRMYGAQGIRNEIPDEPGYGDNVDNIPQVIPYKLAETGDGDSGAKTISIAVPDLFSLITNSQMVPGDEDRKMIQSVILNMKDLKTGEGNWIERIKSLQKYIDTAVEQNIVEARDIRRAISNLIFLNLMKKISFFVAQPGKLFEYIIGPLIGTEAQVLGSTDQQIVDIEKDSQGKTWKYGIKLFTGKTSKYTLKGSRKGLNDIIKKTDTPMTYIIAVAKEETKDIVFSELQVSNRFEHFQPGQWSNFESLNKDCIILKHNVNNYLGVLVRKMNEEYYLSLEQKATKTELTLVEKQDLIEYGNINDAYALIPKAAKTEQPAKTSKPEISAAQKEKIADRIKYESAYTNLKAVKLRENQWMAYLKQDIAPTSTGKPQAADKKTTEFRTYLQEAIVFLNKYATGPEKIDLKIDKTTDLSDFLYNSTDFKFAREEVEQKLKKVPIIITLFLQKYELLRQTIQATIALKENVDDTATVAKTSRQQALEKGFLIDLLPLWTNLAQIRLELGDPKIYNQYQLKIASNLAEDTEKVLNAYKDLNTNLVKFFATSKEDLGAEPGKEPRAKGQVTQANNETGFGDAVIKNATDIEEGVRGFLEKEGTPSQVKE